MTRTTLTLLCSLLCALPACGNGSNADAGDAGGTHDAPAGNDGGGFTDDGGSGSTDDVTTTANRDFTLDARGMTAFQGRGLGVWVVDSTGQSVMAFGYTSALAGADLEFRMPDLLPEGDYHADVFVDGNGNGQFDSGETSWRVPVPTYGSATVHLTGSDAVSDIATPARVPRSDFTATLSGFGPGETGQRFELRVIDPNTRATVGAYLAPQLASGGTLTVNLPGIVDSGNGYNVDFYVDADGNGVYSGPPADHVWRATVQAGDSGATLTWSHSEDYTEVDWR